MQRPSDSLRSRSASLAFPACSSLLFNWHAAADTIMSAVFDAGVLCGGGGRPCWRSVYSMCSGQAAAAADGDSRQDNCTMEETMKSDRRTFLKTTGIVGGALL